MKSLIRFFKLSSPSKSGEMMDLPIDLLSFLQHRQGAKAPEPEAKIEALKKRKLVAPTSLTAFKAGWGGGVGLGL